MLYSPLCSRCWKCCDVWLYNFFIKFRRLMDNDLLLLRILIRRSTFNFSKRVYNESDFYLAYMYICGWTNYVNFEVPFAIITKPSKEPCVLQKIIGESINKRQDPLYFFFLKKRDIQCLYFLPVQFVVYIHFRRRIVQDFQSRVRFFQFVRLPEFCRWNQLGSGRCREG